MLSIDYSCQLSLQEIARLPVAIASPIASTIHRRNSRGFRERSSANRILGS